MRFHRASYSRELLKLPVMAKTTEVQETAWLCLLEIVFKDNGHVEKLYENGLANEEIGISSHSSDNEGSEKNQTPEAPGKSCE